MSNHTGTISAKLTLTDLAEVSHMSCFAKRHVGSLCNTDNTSAGSVEWDKTKQKKTHKIIPRHKATITQEEVTTIIKWGNKTRENQTSPVIWDYYVRWYESYIWPQNRLLYHSDIINDVTLTGKNWSLRSVNVQPTMNLDKAWIFHYVIYRSWLDLSALVMEGKCPSMVLSSHGMLKPAQRLTELRP